MLVLRPDPANNRFAGGILLPDTARLANATGGYAHVVAAGPQCEAKPGQRVHLKSYDGHLAGDEYEHEGEKLILIRERDINGIVVDAT